VKLKTIVTTLGVIGLTTAGFAGQATDTQVAQLQAQLNQLQAQVNAMSQGQGTKTMGTGMVQLNPALAQGTLSTQTGVGTEMTILNGRKSGALNGTLYISGQVKGFAQYNRTDTNGVTSDSSSMHISNDTGLSVLANVNSWVSAFVAVEGFGDSPTSADYNSSPSDLSAPMAYLTFGNLNASPVYGFVGRKDIDFGSFQSVSFNTNPLNRAFEMTGDTLGVGYMQDGFNGTFSVANGGQTAENAAGYTKNQNQINNFSVNGSYSQNTQGVDWKVGAGYVNGFIAKDGAQSDTVGAWDLNASATVNNLTVLGEFDRTSQKVDSWDSAPIDAYIESWDLGAAYAFPMMGKNSSVDVDYSAIKANKTLSQYIVGYNVEAMKNIWVGLEYTYNKGLVQGLTAGTVTDPDAKSNTIALVGTAYF